GATGETVALKVTDWPKTEGFADEVTAVVVSLLLTTCGFPLSDPVLPVKFASPAYAALMVWLPKANDEVVKVATPLASVPVPIELIPSLKVTTSPSGGAAATVAVKVTDCPKTEGLSDDVTVVVVLVRLWKHTVTSFSVGVAVLSVLVRDAWYS